MAEPWRIGVVGLGKIARDQHVPALAASPSFRLVATADPAHALPGVPAFADFATLLAAGPALDAVVLCTPPAVRVGLARQALDAGLHVMLEKPPGRSAEEAAPLHDLAAGRGCTLFAAWHSRAAGMVEPAAEWLAGRAIRSVEVVWRESIDRWHPGQDWLLDQDGCGVFDPASNAFSILTRILPDQPVVECADLFVPANRAAPAEARLVLRSGMARIACDLSLLEAGAQRWDIVVRTDRGELELGAGGHRLRLGGRQQPAAPDAEYPWLYRRFAALIGAGACDFDLAPQALVDAALACGTRHRLAPFHFA